MCYQCRGRENSPWGPRVSSSQASRAAMRNAGKAQRSSQVLNGQILQKQHSGRVEFAMYTHKSQVITFWNKSNLGIQQKKITNSLAVSI